MKLISIKNLVLSVSSVSAVAVTLFGSVPAQADSFGIGIGGRNTYAHVQWQDAPHAQWVQQPRYVVPHYTSHYPTHYSSYTPSYSTVAYRHPYHHGYWNHTSHGNRYGWWWVEGGLWNYYSQPVLPYPQETVIIEQPSYSGSNEPVYSDDDPGYRPVPPPAQVVVQAPQQLESIRPIPQSAPTSYYFCESSQLYYPYAKSCSEKWKVVPSMPEKPE